MSRSSGSRNANGLQLGSCGQYRSARNNWCEMRRRAQGAQIILLQELFETPYFCIDQSAQHFALATAVAENPAVLHFQKLARELQVVLPISFFERANNAFYNTVAIIDADGETTGYLSQNAHPERTWLPRKTIF